MSQMWADMLLGAWYLHKSKSTRRRDYTPSPQLVACKYISCVITPFSIFMGEAY